MSGESWGGGRGRRAPSLHKGIADDLAALERTDPAVAAASRSCTTVGALLYDLFVVECFEEPDFYQLRHVPGERNPEHRWRHKRASGWSRWLPSGAAQRKKFCALPGLTLDPRAADSDPRPRWPDVDTEARP